MRQTVTHLFDAVRYSRHASELEESAKEAEEKLEADLSRLESQTEEFSNLISSMRAGSGPAIRDLCRQLEEFLETAKLQAKEKLERKAKDEAEDFRSTASGEKDKAVKSLEAYLATDPLPSIETVVQIRLSEGIYESRSRHDCEGGIKYDFRLASQNSRLFNQEFTLSQLGYELKVPVRFSRSLLAKNRVPGFERLDQYILTSAETSGGRIRAAFQKAGNSSKIKIVTSGGEANGFIGLEYTDRTTAVNVTNDPTLGAHLDIDEVRKAMGEIVLELSELANKKVALLKLSVGDKEHLESTDCYEILQTVLKVQGPTYRSLMKKIASGGTEADEFGEMGLGFIRERLKVLGDLAEPVSESLGLQNLQ